MEGFGANPDDGGIARRLWFKFKNDSLCALYTPFVVCLASGTLDSSSFLHSISQDVYFLKAFAQAYEMAEDYADDEEDKEALRELRKRVLRKLKDQDDLVREWGFELPKDSSCDSATLRYTDFLLATAAGKVEGEKCRGKIATPFEKTRLAAYALSAIAPCMRLYCFLSKEVKAVLLREESNNIYERWIDCLSSECFEAYALKIEDLLDKLSVSLTGEELDVVEKLYHQAMKLEMEFISAQPITQSTAAPISQFHEPSGGCNLTMFCDFDMTCSAVDSSALLADVAIMAAAKSDLDDCESPYTHFSAADLRATWSNLSSKYIEEYEQCIESIIPSETVGRFDYEGLGKALEQLSEFERRANDMVVHSGVLRGLNQEDMRRAGGHLIFQNGCKNVLQEILVNEKLHADVHVLSYCWSGDLIRSAFSSVVVPALTVHSNELTYEGSVTTGDMIKSMESPMDKLRAFNTILKSRGDNEKHTTVYVGGSVGDLLCLLNADVGIVIGLSSGLKKLGEQFGISFVPLFPGLVTKQRELAEGSCSGWKGMSGILYTVSSWAEIRSFILGL